MEEQAIEQNIPRIKPGPKAKPKVEDELRDRIQNLELLLSKIATLSGHGNHLHEYGLKMWVPTSKDMAKYR